MVTDRRARSQQNDEHIVVGHGADLLRRVHPDEDPAGQQAQRRRQHQAHRPAEQGGKSDALPHPLLAPASELMAKADAEAAGQPLHEAEDKIDHDARGAGGGQRVRPQGPAHDHGVRQRVKQLKKIPADDRQGKQQDRVKDPALRQISCHGQSLRRLNFRGPGESRRARAHSRPGRACPPEKRSYYSTRPPPPQETDLPEIRAAEPPVLGGSACAMGLCASRLRLTPFR